MTKKKKKYSGQQNCSPFSYVPRSKTRTINLSVLFTRSITRTCFLLFTENPKNSAEAAARPDTHVDFVIMMNNIFDKK